MKKVDEIIKVLKETYPDVECIALWVDLKGNTEELQAQSFWMAGVGLSYRRRFQHPPGSEDGDCVRRNSALECAGLTALCIEPV